MVLHIITCNSSILYPSVDASFIFSEAFQGVPNWLSFGKIRACYSQVGSDNAVGPYADNLFFGVNHNLFPNPSGSPQSVGSIPSGVVPNANLKPSRVEEAEFSIEAKLFDNRIGLDLTYYNKITNDRILTSQISDASGFTSSVINVGRSKNLGIEVLLSGTPVLSNNFKWDLSLNFARNTTEVLDLGARVNKIISGGAAGSNSLRQTLGQPLNGLYATAYLRNASGSQIFDTNSGRPLELAIVQ